jgi:transmembrane sensor
MSAQEPEVSIKDARNGIRAMDEAMTWLMRIRDGSVSERDLAEWTVWYESDERHKRAFDEMQKFWIGAGALADDAAGRERIRSLLDEGANRSQTLPVPGVSKRLLVPLALAASVAVVGFTLYALAPRLLRPAPSSAAHPELARETLLPDGSKVELAPRSVLQVRYTPTERKVLLCTGEAYFSVIHDPARPFILSVNGLLIRDVGTAFNIRDANGRTVVTVVKGAIDVVSGSPSPGAGNATAVRVTAGEQVGWDAGERPTLVKADVARTLAWREGRLEYVGQPLASVIADVNRYAHRPVVVGDTAAGSILFTGTVFTRTADEWVQSLPNEFPVELISNGGASLVLASRPVSQTPPGQ